MELKRVLGAGEAAWLVAGNMIGAGIFVMPGLVAGRVPGFFAPLTAWALGGLLALCGAAIYAELGARIPRAGGDYQYLARAFGPVWGFLTGWTAFLLSFSAAVGAMAIVVLDNVAAAFPPFGSSWLAVPWVGGPLIILLLTWANTTGARVAGRTTALMTGVPIAAVALLIAAGLLFGEAPLVDPGVIRAEGERAPLSAFGSAMVLVFFTYTGWNAAAYVAGEIRDPARNLARGLLVGTGLVTVLYLLFNVALLVAVPAETLAGSTTASSDAARLLLGPTAERAVSLAIALAVLGTANVTLMAGARIYYAMAVDGLAPTALGRVNRSGVPAVALWAGGIWSAMCTALGNVEELVEWATLAILLLSSLAVAALFVLRREDPGDPPFLCPAYPLVPAVYLVASLGVAVSSAIYSGWRSAVGLAMVGSGFPVYWLIRGRGRGGAGQGPDAARDRRLASADSGDSSSAAR